MKLTLVVLGTTLVLGSADGPECPLNLEDLAPSVPELQPACRLSLWSSRLRQIADQLPDSERYEAVGIRVEELDTAQSNEWKSQRDQITRDLGRSGFPASDEFLTEFLETRHFMEDVLTRIAARDMAIGYVQGMNFVAYHLKLIGLSREQVYYGLVFFIKVIGPDYYSVGMCGVLVDTQTLLASLSTSEPESGGSIQPQVCSARSRISNLLGRVIRPHKPVAAEDPEPPREPSAVEVVLTSWLPTFFAIPGLIESKYLLRLWDAILFYQRPGWLSLLRALLTGNNCAQMELLQQYSCYQNYPKSLDVEGVLNRMLENGLIFSH